MQLRVAQWQARQGERVDCRAAGHRSQCGEGCRSLRTGWCEAAAATAVSSFAEDRRRLCGEHTGWADCCLRVSASLLPGSLIRSYQYRSPLYRPTSCRTPSTIYIQLRLIWTQRCVIIFWYVTGNYVFIHRSLELRYWRQSRFQIYSSYLHSLFLATSHDHYLIRYDTDFPIRKWTLFSRPYSLYVVLSWAGVGFAMSRLSFQEILPNDKIHYFKMNLKFKRREGVTMLVE